MSRKLLPQQPGVCSQQLFIPGVVFVLTADEEFQLRAVRAAVLDPETRDQSGTRQKQRSTPSANRAHCFLFLLFIMSPNHTSTTRFIRNFSVCSNYKTVAVFVFPSDLCFQTSAGWAQNKHKCLVKNLKTTVTVPDLFNTVEPGGGCSLLSAGLLTDPRAHC